MHGELAVLGGSQQPLALGLASLVQRWEVFG